MKEASSWANMCPSAVGSCMLNYRAAHAQAVGETTSYFRDDRLGREIFLIGTAHVSQKSADEVRTMIKMIKPDRVAVELCARRAARLRAGSPQPDLLRSLGSAFNSFGFLGAGFEWMNATMRKAGLIPGVDFKAALEVADEMHIPIELIDRDIETTMNLLRNALGSLSLAKLLSTPVPSELRSLGHTSIEQAIESLKSRRHLRLAIEYVSECAPSVVDVMLHQRDQFMVDRLSNMQGQRVVAVVGLAHMKGMEQRWRRQT
eukprot:2959471-Pleurochrysis_carterae.AAC.4